MTGEALSSAIAVLPIGCRVKVVGFDLELVIIGIWIKGTGHVQYEVSS
jgi:hypothetical protein